MPCFTYKTTAAYSAPTFIIEIKDFRGKEGERAKFKCMFAGNPTPGNYYH